MELIDRERRAAEGAERARRLIGAEMLANCARYIDRRCEGGHWPSYFDLEAEDARLRAEPDRPRAGSRRHRPLTLIDPDAGRDDAEGGGA